MRRAMATTAQVEDFVAFEGEFSVEVRDVALGKLRFSIKPQEVHRLAIAPYGDAIYTANSENLVLHPEKSGVKRLKLDDELASIHAAGDFLYSVSSYGTVCSHDPQTLEVKTEFELNPADDEVRSIAWARNGRRLVMVDGEDFGLFERRVTTWQCKELLEHEGEGRCAALTDDGSWALLGQGSEVLRYDFTSSEDPEVLFDAGEDIVTNLAISPSGKEFLAICAKPGAKEPCAVHRLNLEGTQLVLPKTRKGVPRAIAYGLKGQRILDCIGELCCATEAGDWVIPEEKTTDWAALRPKEVLSPLKVSLPADVQPLPRFFWVLKKDDANYARDRIGGERVVGLADDWPECGRCGNPMSPVATVWTDPEQLPLKDGTSGLALFLCLSGEGCSALNPKCSHVAFLKGDQPADMPSERNESTIVLEESTARRKACTRTHSHGGWRIAEPPLQICEECDEDMVFGFAFDDEELDDDLLHEFGDQLVVVYCPNECEAQVLSLLED